MEIILILPIMISFVLCLAILPKWIKKCKEVGLLWEDMNKFRHPKNVAASGGIIMVMAFVIGVLSYIAIRTFLLENNSEIAIKVFSLLAVILILAIVGLTDDLLGWKNGGLSAKFRVFLALFASIPLIVINAGQHTISLPLIGRFDLYWIYPAILIPIGVAGATTTYNFLAGFNGLESGQGIIILTFLSFIAYSTGTSWLALIGMIMTAVLIAFYYYNKFPAKVFPGDILTYTIGAMIACMAILGNFEKIALFVFLPYIIETILKIGRGKMKKYSFGLPDKNGNLRMPYDRVYGLTHLSILILSKFKKEVKEKDVVYFIFSFQIVLCLFSLLIFKNSLF